MNIYLVKDKMSGNVVDVVLSQNLDTYKRQFINAYLDVKQKNNFAVIRLWNDCDVYEVEIRVDNDISVQTTDLVLVGVVDLSGIGIRAKKVLVVKDFLKDFESKKGSNLDKCE